jgi:large subunit ribosomal protein L5
MTLAYTHKPPGHIDPIKGERLRTWDDSSPYHKGRPKRGPRGPGSELPIVEKDIDWQNIPKIEEVTVHTMVKGAIDDSAYLHTAGILLQAITGVRPTVHKAKHSVANFGIREGKAIALSSNIRGDAAYEFVDKCINLVMPRIKDFPGIKGSTGDSSGNIGFGFDKEGTILFPEVSVNYDVSCVRKSRLVCGSRGDEECANPCAIVVSCEDDSWISCCYQNYSHFRSSC